jgi:hypothetical protein
MISIDINKTHVYFEFDFLQPWLMAVWVVEFWTYNGRQDLHDNFGSNFCIGVSYVKEVNMPAGEET